MALFAPNAQNYIVPIHIMFEMICVLLIKFRGEGVKLHSN